MSRETVRPDAAIDGGGVDVVGGGSVIECVRDNVQSTYIRVHATQAPKFSFDLPLLPSGSVVRTANMQAMLRRGSSTGPVLSLDWFMVDPRTAPPGAENIFAKRQVTPGFTVFTTATVLTDQRTGVHVAPTDIFTQITAGNQAGATVEIAAIYLEFIYVTKPVVTVDNPTGTMTADPTPPVTWTDSLDIDGANQTHFQVKLFTDAEYGAGGFSPGTSTSSNQSGIVVSGAQSWVPTDPLADDTWRAYVRVAQTVNGAQHWSDWSYTDFAVNIARPAVPTLTLTPEDDDGRIKVQLAANSGAATTSYFQVQTSNDGSDWTLLRTATGDGAVANVGGNGTAYDYEASNGVLRHIRARAVHTYPEGGAVSAWASATATWESDDFWVKNLDDPSLNMVVLVQSQPSTTRVAHRGLFRPLGASLPIAIQDARGGAEGEITFLWGSDSDRDDFADLVESSVVLIQAPADVYDWPDRYCSLGDYERTRFIDKSFIEWTQDQVQWTEVERPE